MFSSQVMSIVPRTVEEIESWMAGEGDDDIDTVAAFNKEFNKYNA